MEYHKTITTAACVLMRVLWHESQYICYYYYYIMRISLYIYNIDRCAHIYPDIIIRKAILPDEEFMFVSWVIYMFHACLIPKAQTRFHRAMERIPVVSRGYIHRTLAQKRYIVHIHRAIKIKTPELICIIP